jgi:hypothetical protein
VGATELTVSQAGSLVRRLEAELASRTEPVVVETTYIDADDPVDEEQHSRYEMPESVRNANAQQLEAELQKHAEEIEPSDE